MLIYTIENDSDGITVVVRPHVMGDVANLAAFNREMDEIFQDGWYDNLEDAEAECAEINHMTYEDFKDDMAAGSWNEVMPPILPLPWYKAWWYKLLWLINRGY